MRDGDPGEAGGEGWSQTEVLLRKMVENTERSMARIQGTRPAEDDQWGRHKLEALREGLRFSQARPTFRRHRDRWDDFAARFCPGKGR